VDSRPVSESDCRQVAIPVLLIIRDQFSQHRVHCCVNALDISFVDGLYAEMRTLSIERRLHTSLNRSLSKLRP